MINSKIILLDDVGFEYFECASNHDGARIANFWTRRLSRKSSSLVWLYSSSTQATCPRKKHHIWGQIWLWVFQSQISQPFSPRKNTLEVWGTINKQAMKDYRAALVTARVNYYAICTFLTTFPDYYDIWLKGWSTFQRWLVKGCQIFIFIFTNSL